MRLGFSLVELSIVLVILGLLTGGILAGQNLIRAAELRKVTTQASSTATAIYTFRDKYLALPGDMATSYDFWGVAAGCTNANVNAGAYVGCNGNGDGLYNDSAAYGEDLRAYQFMAMAGLIEGSYTGSVIATGNKRQFGKNIPAAIYNNAGWWINSLITVTFGKTGNAMTFGKESASFISQPVLSPQEAWSLDKKLDDGKAGLGKITGIVGQVTCYDATTYEYLLTSDGELCTIVQWLN